MKNYKIISLSMAALMAIGAAGCAKKPVEEEVVSESVVEEEPISSEAPSIVEPETEEVSESEVVEIPNPFTDYASIEEANDAMGFEIPAPVEFDNYKLANAAVFPGMAIADMTYLDADNYEFKVRVAKFAQDDASGDWTDYGMVEEEEDITLKGDNDLVNIATWKRGDFTYYAYFVDGLAKDDALGLINAFKAALPEYEAPVEDTPAEIPEEPVSEEVPEEAPADSESAEN